MINMSMGPFQVSEIWSDNFETGNARANKEPDAVSERGVFRLSSGVIQTSSITILVAQTNRTQTIIKNYISTLSNIIIVKKKNRTKNILTECPSFICNILSSPSRRQRLDICTSI